MSTLYMFPPNDTPPEDADLVAGEYVLGVMEPGEAAATRLRADTDPVLRAAIGGWQARLVPLAAMLAPVTPPASLWAQLAAEIGLREPVAEVEVVPEPEAAVVAGPVVEDGLVEAERPAAEPALPEPVVPEPVAAEAVAEAPDFAPTFVEAAAGHPAPAHEPVPEPAVPFWQVAPAAADPGPADPEPHGLVLAPVEPPVEVEAIVPVIAAPAPEVHAPAAASLFAAAFHPDVAFASEPAFEPAPPPAPAPVHLVDRIEVWRAATGAALALAVAIAAIAFFNRPVPEKAVAAIGVVNAPAPLYLAEADADGRLRVTPLAIIAVPNGRDLQLWVIPPGAADPVSLGVLPPGGRTVSLGGAPVEGTRFVVTMEPRGGSPSGRITGQVLYGGTLANR